MSLGLLGRAIVSLSLLAVAASSAAATEPAAAYTRQSYPMALLERPLLLPHLVFQPTLETGLTNTAVGTTEALGLGLDVGITRHLQLGFLLDLAFQPQTDLATFVFVAQTPLGRWGSLRLDVGTQRIYETREFVPSGFTGGLGLPIKVRLCGWLAIVSGSSAARAFGGQPLYERTGLGVDPPLTQDLVSVAWVPYVGGEYYAHGTAEHDVVTGSVFAPVGLLLQPHERVSLTLGSGYRFTFSHMIDALVTPDYLTHSVPVAVELVVSPIRQLDVGVSLFIPGQVADNGRHSGFSSGVDAPIGWGDVRKINIWLAGRI
jgi:hypothetical protein